MWQRRAQPFSPHVDKDVANGRSRVGTTLRHRWKGRRLQPPTQRRGQRIAQQTHDARGVHHVLAASGGLCSAIHGNTMASR